MLTRATRAASLVAHTRKLDVIESGTDFRDGDPATEAEYYRIVFLPSFRNPASAAALDLSWTSKDDVLRGRAIEQQLMKGLFWAEGFTVIPALRTLRNPTLVLHGENDFVPVECAERIARAIPGARLVVIPQCGHFAYIDAPERVHDAIDDFFSARR
jgi:pimeloyl-ACP methyl ester carboxylesterase